MQESRKIESVQLIRLLAAVSIIVFHSNIAGPFGYCGVELLFIVSGFVIMKSTEAKKEYFLLRRFIRLVPLYWITTIFLYFILIYRPDLSLMSTATVDSLTRSLLFLPQQGGTSSMPIVSVGWTINYEVYFYILFFIAMKLSHKYRGIVCSLLLFALCAAASITDNAFIRNMFDPLILECVWGIGLYYIYCFWNKRQFSLEGRTGWRILSVTAAVCLYIYLWFDSFGSMDNVSRCLRLGLPALVFCGIWIILIGNVKIPAILVSMGNMTYSVYIVEFFSTKIYKQIVAAFPMGAVLEFILFLVMVLMTFIVSYISYLVIEKWLTQILLKYLVYGRVNGKTE